MVDHFFTIRHHSGGALLKNEGLSIENLQKEF